MDFKDPKIIGGIVLTVFIVVTLISYFINKNDKTKKDEDIIIQSGVIGLVVSIFVGCGIYFYNKRSNELVFDKKDFWDE